MSGPIVPRTGAGTPGEVRPADDRHAVAARRDLELVPTAAELRAAVSSALAQRLSPRYLEHHGLIPMREEEGAIVIAAAGPLAPPLLDELGWFFGKPPRIIGVSGAELQAAILAAQADQPAATADFRGGDLELLSDEDDTLDDLRALASQPPIIKFVNTMILEALRARASDVHLESTGDGLRVRYRVDGVLQEVSRPPRQYQAAVISRIKIMASLNIAERRVAQDGRIRIRLSDRELDLRVSITPSLHGESVVLRILDRGAGVRDLSELGMTDEARSAFAALIRRPHGIVLVTGPTGSGKTTTLYAGLGQLNAPGVKIVTVEDPVEYQVDGVTQIPVNVKAGLTFAGALRSILRHDPDIIMVGEMRDAETAEIAIQAALTGHLVFSTLHTNDAPGGVIRLVDMGIEPYLVSGTVQGILAQRLVRVVCEDCAEPVVPGDAELAPFGDVARAPGPTPRFRRGRGCDRCGHTGFRGRTGIYEMLVVTDELRDLIATRAPAERLRAAAIAGGMTPLREAGWPLARDGVTTLDEIVRVTQDEVGR